MAIESKGQVKTVLTCPFLVPVSCVLLPVTLSAYMSHDTGFRLPSPDQIELHQIRSSCTRSDRVKTVLTKNSPTVRIMQTVGETPNGTL